jgi:hypothetical protein
MPYKPFLSHRSTARRQLTKLHDELSLRGAGGWQDKDDLNLGADFEAAFKKAIREQTGGFIWWGTRSSLTSETVCKLEIPEGIKRASRRTPSAGYPFVPVLVDLDPGRDAQLIQEALPEGVGKKVLARQGVVKGKRESQTALAARAARRYVHDIVVQHPGDELKVAITGTRAAVDGHDLFLDWHALLDENGRVTDPAVVPVLIETLADIRQAAQEHWATPRIVLDSHLRLPMAAFVGWQWHRLRPINLAVIQSSSQRRALLVEDVVADPRPFGPLEMTPLTGDGPVVLAVSVGKEMGAAADRYATTVNARELRRLHVALPPGEGLDAEAVCGLAQWVIDELTQLNAVGVAKQLLLSGPGSLAVRVGAAANGTGKTLLPFWDGGHGYFGGIEIG